MEEVEAHTQAWVGVEEGARACQVEGVGEEAERQTGVGVEVVVVLVLVLAKGVEGVVLWIRGVVEAVEVVVLTEVRLLNHVIGLAEEEVGEVKHPGSHPRLQ